MKTSMNKQHFYFRAAHALIHAAAWSAIAALSLALLAQHGIA